MATDDGLTAAPAILMVASNLAPASLVVPPPATLGRSVTAAGASHDIADDWMSREHARVSWDRGTWSIRDLESRNGTFVNGERIDGEVKRKGDVLLRIGSTIFVLLADGRGHPTISDGSTVVGPELGRVYERIRQLAQQGGGLLLVQGGPGSGKQYAARVYHAASQRSGPFHAVGCGGLQGVADRLLFGGKKGVVETIGHLQMAHGGTLYLADIAELDPAAQLSLVKFLTSRERIEINVVCSCADLAMAQADGRLRDDLHDLLAAHAVAIPALRTRRVDLIRLMQLEAAELAGPNGKLELHPRLIETCAVRPWPGHARELRAAVRHAATRAAADRRDLIRPEDLLDTAGMPPGTGSAETAVERKTASAPDLGRAALIATLQRAGGNLVVAARLLNLHRTQLAKLLEQAEIPYEGLAYDD